MTTAVGSCALASAPREVEAARPRPGDGPLRVAVLGSGSKGNAVVIESAGRTLLVDAGFSCRELDRRLELLGSSGARVDAVVLTHEHSDHTRGIDVLARRWRVPFYATEGTLEASRLSDGAARRARALRSGWPFEIAGFCVEAFSLPHDARDPVGFVVEDAAGHRIGVVGDLGARSQLAWARLRDLDILILETNHDLTMLRDGPYPWSLKQRVASRHGHLSNREAAEGLRELLEISGADRLQAVVPYHLSQTNNLPEIAAEALGEVLERGGSPARLVLASQDEPTSWLEIR